MTDQSVGARPRAGAGGTLQSVMPNLFVIGASKAGSTALFAYLSRHPQVFMSVVKEPCFFVDQAELASAWPIMARNPVSHYPKAYSALFRDGRDLAYRGEASVYYSQSPHRSQVATRIAASVPDARILYIVREPVTRTIAHYWQRAKEFQDLLPLDEAIRAHPIYRDTSDYAMQLEEYLKVFDRRQIHVVVSEELRCERRAVMSRLFEWLGIEDYEFPEEELADVHVSSTLSRRQRFGFVRNVRDSSLWARARKSLPCPVINRLRALGTEPFDKREVDDSATRAWLQVYFEPRIARFEKLIGRPIDFW